MSDLLKKAYNACFFDVALEVNSEYRVELHKLGVRGCDHDPMVRLQSVIETSDDATQQLFSGFIGSGKSTELLRLTENLEEAGYLPIYVDSEAYLNLRGVVPRTADILMSIAGGVDQFIQDKCEGAIRSEFKSYWERFRTFLGSEIIIDGVTLEVPSVKLGMKLKQDVSFKSAVYSYLEEHGRILGLAEECRNYLDEAKAILKKTFRTKKEIVLIFDSFEKVRGSLEDQNRDIRIAVENIFTRDWDLLQLPFHVIYTVPSWLTFYEFGTTAELGRVCILPMCRITDKESGDKIPDGYNAMRSILEKRMELNEIFEDPKAIDDLIEASGGYPRDLLRMMKDLLLTAVMEKQEPPIAKQDLQRMVHYVIDEQVKVYSKPIFDEDLSLLKEVAKNQDVPRSERSQAFRLAELFDNHFVLGYRNGDEWYDLHPLVKRCPKVREMLEQANGTKSEA